MIRLLNAQTSIVDEGDQMKPLHALNLEAKVNISSMVHPPEPELMHLPKHLKHVFLGQFKFSLSSFLLH